jgi:hypothetical protein
VIGLIVSGSDLELPVAKLAKPVWHRTPPTIPSTFFKADFQVGIVMGRFCRKGGHNDIVMNVFNY